MSATTIERFLLAPAMSNAPRQIGDLCHEDLILGTPRYEDLVAVHDSHPADSAAAVSADTSTAANSSAGYR